MSSSAESCSKIRSSSRPIRCCKSYACGQDLQGASRQFAGDDQPLYLGRAFPDLIDLGIAVPFFDGEIADVTVAAEDLDGVVGDGHGDVTSFELGHARGAGEGLAL